MNDDEYQRLEKLTDRELFDFMTEKDSSQRMWVARHLLEMRRNRVLTSSARFSAIAAGIAAAVAGVSAVIALLSYLKSF